MPELRKQAAELGLETKGTKAEILSRIEKYLKEQGLFLRMSGKTIPLFFCEKKRLSASTTVVFGPDISPDEELLEEEEEEEREEGEEEEQEEGAKDEKETGDKEVAPPPKNATPPPPGAEPAAEVPAQPATTAVEPTDGGGETKELTASEV